MPRTTFGAAVLFVVATAMLPGCMQGAKLVHQDATGGTVAIPENSNVWPTYYRDTAYQKIRETYPTFDPRTDIVEQGEFTVGQQTQNEQRGERRQLGPDGKPLGEITRNTNTTTTTDLKEFRITYRTKPLMQGTNTNNNLIQAGGVQRTSSLPPYGSAPMQNLNSSAVKPTGLTGNPAFGNR